MLNKLKELREKNEGFTIIEVVIVLAIAGLIFAIVFVAVPQLQASQRDTTRRSDGGRLVAAISQYHANQGGGAAPSLTDVTSNVVTSGSSYIEEDTFPYKIVANGSESTDADADGDEAMGYAAQSECDGNSVTSASSRSFAVVVALEQGGTICLDG